MIRVGGWEIGSGIVKEFLLRLGRNRLLGPQNDGLAKAGSNEANSVSWHSNPEGGFQLERAAPRVLQGWRRSELPASQVLYEGVTQDPVPTFDGSQLLRSSS